MKAFWGCAPYIHDFYDEHLEAENRMECDFVVMGWQSAVNLADWVCDADQEIKEAVRMRYVSRSTKSATRARKSETKAA